MSNRRSAYLEAAEREIALWPGVTFQAEQPRGRGHPRLVVAFGGRERIVPFPSTPSDSMRGVRNHITDLRRALRELGATRRELETAAVSARPPKRRAPERRSPAPIIHDPRTGGLEALRALGQPPVVEKPMAPQPSPSVEPSLPQLLRAWWRRVNFSRNLA